MIVTDAWFPQTNGVVSTLAQTAAWFGRFGHEVRMLTPQDFRNVACPTYPEIRLSLFPYRRLRTQHSGLLAAGPAHRDRRAARALARDASVYAMGCDFTTSYHTQFPQYLRARFPIPLCVSYRALRWFHGAAERCMVSTASVRSDLEAHGFKNLAHWHARRRHGDVPAAARRIFSRCRARSPPMSAASPSKRISTHS